MVSKNSEMQDNTNLPNEDIQNIHLDIKNINEYFFKKYKKFANKNFLRSNIASQEETLKSEKNTKKTSDNSSKNLFKYNLPKKKRKIKRIFEEFLVVGVENKGLEYIFDIDELHLNPKILFNFPQSLNESELKFNIKFIANFCFNEGVKVKRYEIDSNTLYEQLMFDQNFFSKPKKSFCLLQQITPEDVQKYFVFGIKFDDFYITPIKDIKKNNDNRVNVFICEKTYLFIANDPLCVLFEKIFQSILNVKKMNFLNNLDHFSTLFEKDKFNVFSRENMESTSYQIKEILEHFVKIEFPKFDSHIIFESRLNTIMMDYYHLKESEKNFLAIEWLSKRFFNYYDLNDFYGIIVRLLVEQSFIFISNDIEILTISVLGFSEMIRPFVWPYIIIPNLPYEMMEVIESPVPILIGIIGDKKTKKQIRQNSAVKSNIIYIDSKRKVKVSFDEELSFRSPHLGSLKNLLYKDFLNLNIFLKNNQHEEYQNTTSNIYKTAYKCFEKELCSHIISSYNTAKLEAEIENADNMTEKQYNTLIGIWKEKFNLKLSMGDKSFGEIFSQTQLFLNFINELKKN